MSSYSNFPFGNELLYPPNSTLCRCSGDDVEPRDPGDFEETGDWEKNSNEQDSNSSSWG
jgi:hypothetical protein